MTAPGALLVASPGMSDPTFATTVVYLFAGEDGPSGVILNRPTDLNVSDALPQVARLTVPPRKVFFGGPVRTEEALIMGSRDGSLLLIDDESRIDELDEARVFAGYAGWAPGQLESEIGAGSWFVVDANTSDVMNERPEDLWRAVLARQPDELQRYGTYPDDPSLN